MVMTNEDIVDALDRLTKAVDTINLQPRRRYHYATLPAEDVLQSARVCTDPDSYTADDPISAAARDLLKQGYRWVRCDHGLAVFEKQA
jgi:hypothetical protein